MTAPTPTPLRASARQAVALLPCPCGAVVDTDECPYPVPVGVEAWRRIVCTDPDCAWSVTMPNDAEAIAAWNRRALPDSVPAEGAVAWQISERENCWRWAGYSIELCPVGGETDPLEPYYAAFGGEDSVGDFNTLKEAQAACEAEARERYACLFAQAPAHAGWGKDAERLDWLAREFETHGCINFRRYSVGVAGCELFTVSSQHVRGYGLRGAIDAALASSGSQP